MGFLFAGKGKMMEKKGLSIEEVVSRQKKYGPNKLKERKKDSFFIRFVKELKDPMLVLLLLASGVSAVTDYLAGESLVETWIILIVVLVNALLGVVQESKAENAIAALSSMNESESVVIRDGNYAHVPSSELVPGDYVVLEAGTSIGADGFIRESASLQVEESALTGESVPVTKEADQKVFMGSSVLYGRGVMEVTSIGMQTEIGKIAEALNGTANHSTPLQIKLNELGKKLSLLVLVICVVIFVTDIFEAGSFTLTTILQTFMIAVSLAVAAIPEGLATVVTLVLSAGVTRMSHRKAIIRKMTAVETLGCTQVICTDKTGTLTENRMKVMEHTGNQDMLCKAMCLCNDAVLNPDGSIEGEATESALLRFAEENRYEKNELQQIMPRVNEIPFDSSRKRMSTIHRLKDGTYIQFTKGAPDEILKCSSFIDKSDKKTSFTEEQKEKVQRENDAMANKALRVMAASYKLLDTLPEKMCVDTMEKDMTFIGLCGMMDPLRKEIPEAIQKCKDAGIRAVMITGDNKQTAIAIAKKAGILQDGYQACTGKELDQMDENQLLDSVEKYSVYARVRPEHKVRIVKAWQKKGYVAAMSGDGVNDAPSIHASDIGIDMGINGTDVTRNVADMILADDNFATIVTAVEEGRRIYDNIRKAVQFLLSSNVSEVIGVFVSSLLGFTLLKPVHLLFINLITDTFPALALAKEKGEGDVMKRKPRKKEESLFAGGMAKDIILQGIWIAFVAIVSYMIGNYYETGTFDLYGSVSNHGMTMAFLTMNMCEIFHSFNCRSLRRSIFSLHQENKSLWISLAFALVSVTAVLEIPFLANLFGFTSISLKEYMTALGLSVLVIPFSEIVKKCKKTPSEE